MKNLYPFICILSLLMVPASVKAQFHAKSSSGQTEARQMNNNLNSTTGYQMPGPANRKLEASKLNVVGISPNALAMADKVSRETGNHVKIGIATMSLKDADVWGRAENHPDGTYTETIFDTENKQADNLIIQKTKRKSLEGEDPVVLTRKISLNLMGQADEVMIYDGAGRYKYHGKFIYDSMGRIIEEQLRDAKGTPLRRTVQAYSASGDYLPLKTYDYVKSIPQDLQLVISKSDETEMAQLDEMNRLLYEAAEAKGFMAGRKKRKAEAAAQELQEQFQNRNAAPQTYQGAAPIPTASAQEVGGKKFQLFKPRSRN